MKVMEKASAVIESKNEPRQPLRLGGIAVFLLSVISGVIFSGAFGGRSSISVCTALSAVLSPFGGTCCYLGSLSAYLLTGSAGQHLAEIAAMPLLTIVQFFVTVSGGKRFRPITASISAAAAYIACGFAAAIAGKITAVLILAIIFRGLFCGMAAYFLRKFTDDYLIDGKFDIIGENAIGTAVIYVLTISALSGISTGGISIGSIVGMFFILAAAGRFSCGGAAATGALTSLGIILGSGSDASDSVKATVLMTCAGIICCCMAKKSKLAAAVSFICAMLVLQLFMGSLYLAADIMLCTVIAAALYCFIPDRLYMRIISTASVKPGTAAGHFRRSVEYAAEAVGSVINSMNRAADILEPVTEEKCSISETVCAEICSGCRSSAFCCKGDKKREASVFPLAEAALAEHGFLTTDMLPKSLESCTKRAEITDIFNREYRKAAYELHFTDASSKMREVAFEQLAAAEDMLRSLSLGVAEGCECDEILSESVRDIMEKSGAVGADAAVYFDRHGRIFISCMIKEAEGFSCEKVAERLAALTDRQLEPPELFGMKGMTRLCFREPAAFETEAQVFSAAGHEEVSGDSNAVFTDGFGNVCYVISDGMGSGSEAAAESMIAVALLKKLIRAGAGIEAAVRTANLMLLTKSARESFATLDILMLNLYNGHAVFYKLGAAVSFISSGGLVREIESESLPLGIVSTAEFCPRSFSLENGDAVLMMSDGISESFYPRLRELIQSDALSAKRCGENIMAETAPLSDEEKAHSDDRTVIIIKIHKI